MTLKLMFVIGMIICQVGLCGTNLYQRDLKQASVAGLLAVVNYVIFMVK